MTNKEEEYSILHDQFIIRTELSSIIEQVWYIVIGLPAGAPYY